MASGMITTYIQHLQSYTFCIHLKDLPCLNEVVLSSPHPHALHFPAGRLATVTSNFINNSFRYSCTTFMRVAKSNSKIQANSRPLLIWLAILRDSRLLLSTLQYLVMTCLGHTSWCYFTPVMGSCSLQEMHSTLGHSVDVSGRSLGKHIMSSNWRTHMFKLRLSFEQTFSQWQLLRIVHKSFQ